MERSGFAIAEAPPGGLALGSLSIVRRAEAAAGPDAADPLRVAGVVIHPELGPPQLTRSMPEIPLFLPVYPSLAATSPEIHIELLRDGQPVAQARPPLPAPEPDGRIAWIGGLPAKPLAPGRYEIVATVRQGDVSAEERTSFEVAGGDRGPGGHGRAPLPCRPISCPSSSGPPGTCSTTSRPSTTSWPRRTTRSGPRREAPR